MIGLDGDEGKGSGRSVSGVDLGASIQRLAAEGLLIKGGGHKMAAGLTVARDKLDAAMARLTELLAKQGADRIGPADLRLDGLLTPRAATIEAIEQIEAAGPFGAGAPGPRFVFADSQITFARQVGDVHLKLRLTDGFGASLDAIAFGAFDTALGPALAGHEGARFHLAGRLEINTWGGRRSVQLRLEDAAPAFDARHRISGRAGMFFQKPSCALRGFCLVTRRVAGPFVYRLGRQVFNLERGVRLPYGLPFLCYFFIFNYLGRLLWTPFRPWFTFARDAVISYLVAIALNSLIFAKKFSTRCRHLQACLS